MIRGIIWIEADLTGNNIIKSSLQFQGMRSEKRANSIYRFYYHIHTYSITNNKSRFGVVQFVTALTNAVPLLQQFDFSRFV